MAAVVAEAAAQLRPNFVRGQKKLFLPNHVITFIRPKPKQSPNLASFMVPLQFNKLDLRDYLWHAYNVKVLSVRSYVAQRPPETKGHLKGQIYRPRPQKMMMVELAKPFVWPEPLQGEDLEAFDNFMWKSVEQSKAEQLKTNDQRSKGVIPLRTEGPQSQERKALAEQAKALLEGREVWRNGKELDERWTEIEKDEGVKRR